MINPEKEKWNRRVLFTALRAGEALEVCRLEREGEVSYGFTYGDKKETSISKETLLQKLDHLGWKDWQVEAKGLMQDFSLGMEVLERIREEGREPWRKWLRSAGWLQATIAGCGNWGSRVVDLLRDEKLSRYASLGNAQEVGLFSSLDRVRILILDSVEDLTPEIKRWIQGEGNSLAFIFTRQMPQKKDLPGLWIEVSPMTFHGALQELIHELLEGCYPFGLLSNALPELLPYFQRPYEGLAKNIIIDGEEWLDEATDDILGTVGWDSQWGEIQMLFLLIQSSQGLVDPAQLYPLSLAIRQGVPPTCRVMATVKENKNWRSERIQILLLGMKPENKVTPKRKRKTDEG